MLNTARSFVFTTALPAPTVAASLAALEVVECEPERVARLRRNASVLRGGLREIGFDTLCSESHIVPVLVGDTATALRMGEELRLRSVFAVAIRPPTVPAGKARIRVSAMATHTDADIDVALRAFHEAGRACSLLS